MALTTSSSPKNIPASSHDERILVVPRSDLFFEGAWHGIKEVDFDAYLDTIAQHKQFLWRSVMEEDPTYKQIIPYLIFQYQDRFFLMQRRPNASAKALQNKFSLGIGGHIRQEDMTNGSLFSWAEREFHEEVSYQGSLTIKPIGIINDDTNAVGQVHLGFAMLLVGDSSDITIKDEHKSGVLVALDECATFYDSMETWSKFIVDILKVKTS